MSHTIKVDVKLGFIRWKDTDEPIHVVLAGTPDELNTNSVLDGVLTLEPGKLYEIMKSANERGEKPVLELTIAEDPKPGIPPEMKKDKDQTELVLDRDPGPAPKPAGKGDVAANLLAGEKEGKPPDVTGPKRDESGKFLKKVVDKKPIVK